MKRSEEKTVLMQGFTLVEILVAIAIFMIVMVSTLGAFLSMVDLNKKVQAVRVAMDNANLAMEEMMREMRLGYDFSEISSGISFTNQNGVSVAYELQCDPGSRENECVLAKREGTNSFLPITSPDVNIEIATFELNGGAISDDEQPTVKIFIKGKTNLQFRDNLNFDFVFQSLATQRLYDK